jgi:phosphoribosylanthranilate isomerase
MIVKICGITRLEDARAAIEGGAQALGFVFWPASPRSVDAETARAIVAELPALVTAVGVFVNQPADQVNAIADRVGLGAVQLHGDESVDYVARIVRPVVKAFPIGGETRAEDGDRWPGRVRLLLDVRDPTRRGGTGRTVDWTVAAAVAARRPVLLAGGLTPENVAEAVARVRPYGIDVSSGVESAPGVKDHRRLEMLFAALAEGEVSLEGESLRSSPRSSARGGGAPRASKKR